MQLHSRVAALVGGHRVSLDWHRIRLSSSLARGLLCLTILLCGLASLKAIVQPGYLAVDQQVDFNVYHVAADLVRQDLDPQIYADAGTGEDTQSRFADPATMFARTARELGLDKVRLYVYPPLWADIVAPLTVLPVHDAAVVWRILNLGALAAIAAMTSALLGFRSCSPQFLVILVGLLSLKPVWTCLSYGQVGILLSLLWVGATILYVRGWKGGSALLVAIAVTIKMTPLAFAVPMLIWRDWRWIAWFTGALTALIGFMCLKNGLGTCLFYVRDVVPTMTGGYVNLYNRTINSGLEMAWLGPDGAANGAVPPVLILVSKTLSATIIAFAAYRTYRLGTELPVETKVLVLAAFALLSLCIAPVAWGHAYVQAFLMLAVMWRRTLETPVQVCTLLLTVATTLTIGSFSLVGGAMQPVYLVAFSGPVLGVTLCLHGLASRGFIAPQQTWQADPRAMDAVRSGQ